jgi:hypothetical protein
MFVPGCATACLSGRPGRGTRGARCKKFAGACTRNEFPLQPTPLNTMHGAQLTSRGWRGARLRGPGAARPRGWRRFSPWPATFSAMLQAVQIVAADREPGPGTEPASVGVLPVTQGAGRRPRTFIIAESLRCCDPRNSPRSRKRAAGRCWKMSVATSAPVRTSTWVAIPVPAASPSSRAARRTPGLPRRSLVVLKR